MQLLISPTSPYARKARIVILEKNIPCDVTVANPWEEGDTEVAQKNPLRKIPILLLDDGTVVTDSRLICEVLDAQDGAPRFLPSDSAQRIAVKAREAIAEGAIDAAIAIIMAKRIAPDMQDDNWKNWLLAKTDAALDYFERDIGSRAADAFDAGDINLACLLDFLHFRLPAHDWLAARPQLARWFERIGARDSLQQTVPQG